MKRIRSQINAGGKTRNEKPAQNLTKSKASTATAQRVKSEGLNSNKASGKIAEKLATGTKVEEKKTK